jgi:AraC-like DNA-binding protein
MPVMPKSDPFRARIPFHDPGFPLRVSHIVPLMDSYAYLHTHPEFEIAYFPKDHGTYMIQDVEVPIEPGDLFIVNANEIHQPILRGRRNRGAVVTYFRSSLFNDPEECAQWLEPFLHARELDFNRLRADNELRDLVLRLHAAADPARRNWKIMTRGLLTHLLAITAASFEEHCARTKATRRIARAQRFAPVVAYINENLTDHIEARTLYRLAGLSHSRFSEAFRAAFGMSLVQYIRQQRLRRARRLLRSTEMKVTDIAFTSGFSSVTLFNRLFKAESGLSPTQFRRAFP